MTFVSLYIVIMDIKVSSISISLFFVAIEPQLAVIFPIVIAKTLTCVLRNR